MVCDDSATTFKYHSAEIFTTLTNALLNKYFNLEDEEACKQKCLALEDCSVYEFLGPVAFFDAEELDLDSECGSSFNLCYNTCCSCMCHVSHVVMCAEKPALQRNRCNDACVLWKVPTCICGYRCSLFDASVISGDDTLARPRGEITTEESVPPSHVLAGVKCVYPTGAVVLALKPSKQFRLVLLHPKR